MRHEDLMLHKIFQRLFLTKFKADFWDKSSFSLSSIAGKYKSKYVVLCRGRLYVRIWLFGVLA